MPRPVVSLREKLAIHERKSNELIAARQKELMAIFKVCNAVTVDDTLLTGFLVFAMDEKNKDSQILQQFMVHAKASNLTGKSRQTRKKKITKTI